jgi:hypothetical protein
MIHGWRPTSVTVHPASMARNPIGAASTSARNSQRLAATSRRRHATHPAQSATAAMKVPSPTIAWKATWTIGTGGQSRSGTRSSPATSALGLSKASTESAYGTSIAHRVSRRRSSGQPPMRSGAPRSVTNCPSIAASFAGW